MHMYAFLCICTFLIWGLIVFSLHMKEKTTKQAITFSFVKEQQKYQASSESLYNVHKYESSLWNEYPPEKGNFTLYLKHF